MKMIKRYRFTMKSGAEVEFCCDELEFDDRDFGRRIKVNWSHTATPEQPQYCFIELNEIVAVVALGEEPAAIPVVQD
jgi:hypothetical protein